MDELAIFPAQDYAAPAAVFADHLIKMIKECREPKEIDTALHAELARFDWCGRYIVRQRLIKAFQEKAPDLLTPDVQDLLEGRKS
jgi:hypothetical protein